MSGKDFWECGLTLYFVKLILENLQSFYKRFPLNCYDFLLKRLSNLPLKTKLVIDILPNILTIFTT